MAISGEPIHLGVVIFNLWSSSFLVVFIFGCLHFWLSSFLVVFIFGRLPFWVRSSSIFSWLIYLRTLHNVPSIRNRQVWRTSDGRKKLCLNLGSPDKNKKNLAREDTRLPFPLKQLVVTKWTFCDPMIPYGFVIRFRIQNLTKIREELSEI